MQFKTELCSSKKIFLLSRHASKIQKVKIYSNQIVCFIFECVGWNESSQFGLKERKKELICRLRLFTSNGEKRESWAELNSWFNFSWTTSIFIFCRLYLATTCHNHTGFHRTLYTWCNDSHIKSQKASLNRMYAAIRGWYRIYN